MTKLWPIVLAIALAGCLRGEHREARDRYNEGVEQLAAGNLDGAVKSLVQACSDAGVDPELRHRAAYNLGVALSAQAEKLRKGEGLAGGGNKKPELDKARAAAQDAVSWFLDAKQRKADPDTVANLAIARARLQHITDELRRAEGKLEARLDAIIDAQRGVLEGARYAWIAIKGTTGADPLAQQTALTSLADRERGVVADAGVITDLAGEEIDTIGKKPEDKRSDEEKVRIIQLKNVDLYVMDARTRIAETRRKLQDLAAEDAVAKAEAALVSLKRAREQLLDPITVLQGLAREEVEVVEHTRFAGADSALQTGDGAHPQGKLPAWLEPTAIAERQAGVRDRLEEVRKRLEAGTAAPPPEAKPDDPQAAQRAKLIVRVKAALPKVQEASAAMDQARQLLAAKKARPALEPQHTAIVALAAAIEQFSDLRQTIELAHAEQRQLLVLLGPEAGKTMAPVDRATETRDALARNLARMTRLKELIADEVVQITAQQDKLAAAPAPPAGAGSGSGSAGAPSQADAQKQALIAERDRLSKAEGLRIAAQLALEDLDKILAGDKKADAKKDDAKKDDVKKDDAKKDDTKKDDTASNDVDPSDPLVPAKLADAKLDELRKLFFNLIEHLQELIREQAETRDQTSAASGEDDHVRGPKLPGLVGREEQHGGMAKAITEALAQQADEAAKKPQQQPGQPDGKTLSEAAEEMRKAQAAIDDARGSLVKARDAKKTTESLAPAVKSQATAIEHLTNALKLLQPPKDQNEDNEKKQQQKQKQQQQQQQQQQNQSARDKDAERQRKRQQQKKDSTSDPVEKDW